MTDPDYEIPEFSYARRRREPAFDPLMRRIALGASGVAVLVIVVALVWGGIKPGATFGPPPVIQPPPGPLRVLPANPGGITVPGADQQIMSGDSTATPDALAPATPAPDISAFQAPAAPSPPAPAPQQALAPQQTHAPQQTPAGATASAPTPPTAPPAAGNGNVQVQLAAAVDPAGAKAAWARLSEKMPSLLAGRTPIYTHAVVAGVEFWRLRLGGFSDTEAARQFCAAVKAQGGACTVAAF